MGLAKHGMRGENQKEVSPHHQHESPQHLPCRLYAHLKGFGGDQNVTLCPFLVTHEQVRVGEKCVLKES